MACRSTVVYSTMRHTIEMLCSHRRFDPPPRNNIHSIVFVSIFTRGNNNNNNTMVLGRVELHYFPYWFHAQVHSNSCNNNYTTEINLKVYFSDNLH
jgi:hypothetical protein